MKDILVLYRNYLFLIKEREEFGDKYGDTEELKKIYEKKLKKVLKIDNIDTL